MNPIAKKEILNNPNYVHKTQEERSKSQNKNHKISQRIKSSRPAFSSKKENINSENISNEGNQIEKFKGLRRETINHTSSATEIAEISTTKANNDNSYNQSFLNDFSLNIQVSNSLNNKNANRKDEKRNAQTIQEYEIEETQRLLINQKKNNFLKNNQSQDQKQQSNNVNAANNYPNNPNVAKVTKQNPIKLRQRSNSPTFLKQQGYQVPHQNRIISANLHSKALAAGNGISEFKINGQNGKRRDQLDDTTINSNEDSIVSNFQKEKSKQLQGDGKPIAQLKQQHKKIIEKGQGEGMHSSNNSSDVENNNEISKDRRVKSISITPGIVFHNQYNLKESQNTFDALETSSFTNVSEKRKSMESENKLPRINKVIARQKETTLYNQLRESNQKNALELPQIIDNIKQNVNSCENLFKNRLKDRLGGFQGQFQQASASSITKKQDGADMNQYDFDVHNDNKHQQFDKAIAKSNKGRENIPISILNKNINPLRQVESAKKRDSTIPFSNRNNTKDDSSLQQESPNQIYKYIRQSQHSEQRESVNRRDSSISYKQQNSSAIQQSLQARNRIKSEHNVMQNSSSGNYPEKLITEDSEGEPNSTADRKKMKKLNQINKYLKNKMDMQKQMINQISSNQGVNGGNSISLQNNSTTINSNISNPTNKPQPHNKVQLQIQQQQLLQISKNQQLALSNQKQQNLSPDARNNTEQSQPQQNEGSQSNKHQYQKGVIEVLDQALFKRKEDKVNKSISQQIEKEIDKLNVLTSKSTTARDEQLRIQEELIKYNLKIKLGKMKIVDTVLENEHEEQL